MATSKANATWDGALRNGRGAMKPAHGPEIPFSAGTRFEGQAGSNPEELIGAALAGCFSMALSLELEKAGATPRSIHTSASVQLEREGGGFAITAIALATEVAAAGLDEAKLRELADTTKKNCPVSKALRSVDSVTVSARLKTS